MKGRLRIAAVGALVGVACLAVPHAPTVSADGSETLGTPSVPLATGTGVVNQGVGLQQTGTGTISFTVPAGSTVKQALLYWECHFSGPAGGDASILVNGNPVAGTSIGGPTETAIAGLFFQSWRADVTSMVVPGANSLAISGVDCFYGAERGSDGAGVIVIFENASGVGHIALRDGLDLAYINAPAPPGSPLLTTVAQTFTIPVSAQPRPATIHTQVGSVQGPASGLTPTRPNYLSVSYNGGPPTLFAYPWASTDGFEYDAVDIPITIPAGTTTVTIQALSQHDPANPNLEPASLAWIVGGLSIAPPPPPPPVPGIDIRKQAEGPDSRTFPSGSTVTFTIRVTNTGQVPLTNVTVTDPLAPNCAKTIGDLAVGAFHEYTCTVANVVAGFTNEACVAGTHPGGQVTDCDPSTVVVTPPPGVCTRTQGYWKTHAGFGPQPRDPAWNLLPGGLGPNTQFFQTGKTWIQVFNTEPKGNAYWILAHQYMAAVLNQLAGANTSSIAAQLTQAAQLLDTYDGNPQPMSKVKNGVKTQFTTLAGTLDAFNNGKLGPTHCG